MNDYKELIASLREEADAVQAIEWEIPICTSNHIAEAADVIEQLAKDLSDAREDERHAEEYAMKMREEHAAAVSGQWISVKDRMPERIPCKAGTSYSEAVAVLTKGRVVLVAVWDGIDWIGAFDYWDVMGEEITHWKALTPLPKETEHETD